MRKDLKNLKEIITLFGMSRPEQKEPSPRKLLKHYPVSTETVGQRVPPVVLLEQEKPMKTLNGIPGTLKLSVGLTRLGTGSSNETNLALRLRKGPAKQRR